MSEALLNSLPHINNALAVHEISMLSRSQELPSLILATGISELGCIESDLLCVIGPSLH